MDGRSATYHFRAANGVRGVVEVLGDAVELLTWPWRRAVRLNPKQAELLRALVTAPAGRVSYRVLRRMHEQARLGAAALKEAISSTVTGLAKALGDPSSVARLKGYGCQLMCRLTELSLECPRVIVGHQADAYGRTSLAPEESEVAVYVSPNDGPERHRTYWHQGSGHVHGRDWVSRCRFGNFDWIEMPLRKSKDLDFSVYAVAVERSAELPGSDPHPAVSAQRFRQLLNGPRTLAVAGPVQVKRLFRPQVGPDKIVAPQQGQEVPLGVPMPVKWTPRERDMMVELRFRGRAIFFDFTSSGRTFVLEHPGRYEVKVFHPQTPERKLTAWIECVDWDLKRFPASARRASRGTRP